MSKIVRVVAREVLDSRGHPTVEVEVHCRGDRFGRASVPAGASTGAAEACELRDGDMARYDGRGVRRAVDNVNRTLGPAIVGMEPTAQAKIDFTLGGLDGTATKSRLGANAILGVSLAVAHAAAAVERVPLYSYFQQWFAAETDPAVPPPRMPLPMVNMISGGKHAGGQIEFQDFLAVPLGAPSYATALEWIVRVTRRLSVLLSEAGYEGRLVADEGGYGPRLPSNAAACEFVVRAIEAAGLRPGDDVALALDVASTHFFDGQGYTLAATGAGERWTAAQMIDELERLADRYPIVSIEDGLAEDDWDGWRELTRRLGKRIMLVGDDLFATNTKRLEHGASIGVANSILIKVNQIGTLTETLFAMRSALADGYLRVVSARSGETEDATIADLAVGTSAEMIKIGAVQRSERLAKYNQLLRIEEALGARPLPDVRAMIAARGA